MKSVILTFVVLPAFVGLIVGALYYPKFALLFSLILGIAIEVAAGSDPNPHLDDDSQ